jgi:hypothetical protein
VTTPDFLTSNFIETAQHENCQSQQKLEMNRHCSFNRKIKGEIRKATSLPQKMLCQTLFYKLFISVEMQATRIF